MTDQILKSCTKCGEAKPLEDFHVDRRAKCGRVSRCKPCFMEAQRGYDIDHDARKQRIKEWGERYPDKVREKTERWRERNREHYLAQKKKRRDETREERALAWARWYEANREKVAARFKANYDPEKKRAGRTPEQSRKDRERRRARLLDAFVEDVPFDEIVLRDLGVCGICQQPILESPELDHVVPLAAGGTHERSNVQLAHLACNRRKGTRLTP